MRASLQSVAVLILVVLVAAACGGSFKGFPTAAGPSGLHSATPSTPAGGSATPSTGASGSAKPSTSAGSSAAPNGQFHAAVTLEQTIPTQAGGLPLTVESVTGAGFTDANGNHKPGLRCRWYEGRGLRCRDQQYLATVLAALGKSPQDVTIAVGYNETKSKEIEVQATRVSGVTGTQVRDAVLSVLRDAATKDKGTLNAATTTVGGKSVVMITNGSTYPLGLHRYLYANGDTFFDIRRADDAPAAEILQHLP